MPPDCDTFFDRAREEDWHWLRQWAAGAGWRVSARELQLLCGRLADGTCVLRAADGRPSGFVTVARHELSGWIGNLIVAPQQRGRGIGRRLLEWALVELEERGVQCQWLTASPAGVPLYRRCGFVPIGLIERWGRPAAGMGGAPPAEEGALQPLLAADRQAWGESRMWLLAALAVGSSVYASGTSLLMLQSGSDFNVIGPWLSANHCPRSNRQVLAAALDALGGGGEVVVDLFATAPETALLAAAGFSRQGESLLMCRGPVPPGERGAAVALATLGSLG